MTEPLTVHAAIAAVMADVTHVGKDGVNEQQKFKFRGIDHTVNALGPAFRTHGLIVLPRLLSKEYREYQTKHGTSRSCSPRTNRTRTRRPWNVDRLSLLRSPRGRQAWRALRVEVSAHHGEKDDEEQKAIAQRIWDGHGKDPKNLTAMIAEAKS